MKFIKLFATVVIFTAISCTNNQQPSASIDNLPAPQIKGGKPLMLALRDRKTTRDFSDKELSLQQISDLLWAANGINRPAEKRHTAPTARNRQELDIYVAMKSGVYLFDADNQKLIKQSDKDIRAEIGDQDFHKIVPLTLILVADLNKAFEGDTTRNDYETIDAGYISQNIYLYCASENLATVAVGWINRPKIDSLLHLSSRQRVIIAHPVGYPK
ncbi:MAG TPA: SagB/ThcOx family dehydrogenase [Bacteroidales bacterium]|nr:SagB/ThcOx family dehydrogenase [Bacteroidales bacterium]